MTNAFSLFSTLKDRIARHEARVTTVGLGYVGLPLALTISETGFPTTDSTSTKRGSGRSTRESASSPISPRTGSATRSQAAGSRPPTISRRWPTRM